jgi:hypothetical protein
MDRSISSIDDKPAKLVRFAGLGPHRLALLAEAVTALAVARVIVATLSPARVARQLGRALGPGEEPPREARHIGDTGRVAELGWAVRCAAVNVPFRAKCLEQALAARILFDRRSIEATVHYGIAPRPGDHGGARAHAWVEAAGAQVTGYPVRPAFRAVARFGSRRLTDSQRHDR